MNVITPIDAKTHPFLIGKPKRLFIDGKWVEAASGKTFDTHNPSTGAVLASVAEGDSEDIDRAVDAAHPRLQRTVAQVEALRAGALLLKLADLVEAHFEELAALDTLDMGAPIRPAPAATGCARSACCASTPARRPRSTARRSRIRCPASM